MYNVSGKVILPIKCKGDMIIMGGNMKKRILKLISCVAFAGTLFTSNTLAVFAQTEGTPANTESTPAPAENQSTAEQPAEGTPASTENTATPAEGQPTNTATTETAVDKAVISDFIKSLKGQSLSVNEIVKKANDAGITVLVSATEYPSMVGSVYKNLTKQEALEQLKAGKLQTNDEDNWIDYYYKSAGKVYDAPNQSKVEIPSRFFQDSSGTFEETIEKFLNGIGVLDEKHVLSVSNDYIDVKKDIPIREVFVPSIGNKNAFVVNTGYGFDVSVNDTFLFIKISNYYRFYQSSDFWSNPQSNTITKVNSKSNSKVKDTVDTSDATLSSALLLLGSAIALVRLNKKK